MIHKKTDKRVNPEGSHCWENVLSFSSLSFLFTVSIWEDGYLLLLLFSSSGVSLFDPMDCSMAGFPVLHRLLELAQTHVHWVSDAIQASYPLSFPSLPAFNLTRIRVFFNESALHIRWPKCCDNHFTIYVNQTMMLVCLKLNSDVCQWVLSNSVSRGECVISGKAKI